MSRNKNQSKINRVEVWLCFSSVSYVLASCYIQELFNALDGSYEGGASFLVLSRGPLDTKTETFLRKTSDVSVQGFTLGSYFSYALLFWKISISFLKGCEVIFKLPHLSEYVVGRWIKKLAMSNLFSVEFYDDGLLGCLSNPTVLSFYPETISNICHWDIAGWKPPVSLNIVKHSSIKLRYFAGYTQVARPSSQHGARAIVLEAKYMNYKLLNQMFEVESSKSFQEEIFYFQHPSFHKRNLAWPSNIKTNFIQKEQCETWLLSNLTDQSHIYSSVTSTVVVACDFARQKLIRPFKLTLLIEPSQSPKGLESFYDSDEAADFKEYIKSSYSEIINITFANTGGRSDSY